MEWSSQLQIHALRTLIPTLGSPWEAGSLSPGFTSFQGVPSLSHMLSHLEKLHFLMLSLSPLKLLQRFFILFLPDQPSQENDFHVVVDLVRTLDSIEQLLRMRRSLWQLGQELFCYCIFNCPTHPQNLVQRRDSRGYSSFSWA